MKDKALPLNIFLLKSSYLSLPFELQLLSFAPQELLYQDQGPGTLCGNSGQAPGPSRCCRGSVPVGDNVLCVNAQTRSPR